VSVGNLSVPRGRWRRGQIPDRQGPAAAQYAGPACSPKHRGSLPHPIATTEEQFALECRALRLVSDHFERQADPRLRAPRLVACFEDARASVIEEIQHPTLAHVLLRTAVVRSGHSPSPTCLLAPAPCSRGLNDGRPPDHHRRSVECHTIQTTQRPRAVGFGNHSRCGRLGRSQQVRIDVKTVGSANLPSTCSGQSPHLRTRAPWR
jgi:hypothetical protein